MIRFECDYVEGGHPLIMERLVETNFEQTPGYGRDRYCISARKKILKSCKTQSADVHFMVGGTIANLTVIASILRPHQGVVAASSSHINVHETGAIEALGHKILTLPSAAGKISAKQILDIYNAHFILKNREHSVQPGMVYISQATENGTLYSKAELKAISAVCKKCKLPLFLDGARLGYGLAAKNNDLTLADIAKLCDAFYIGGTKVGALFGEAVIITNKDLQKDFRYFIKQKGGLLAKGRLLGIQFDVLFEDDLYFKIAKHAVDLAMMIKKAFANKGFKFLFDSHTNQQFPIISNKDIKTLSKKYSFDFWQSLDKNKSAVRFCTSWASKKEDVEELIRDIKGL